MCRTVHTYPFEQEKLLVENFKLGLYVTISYIRQRLFIAFSLKDFDDKPLSLACSILSKIYYKPHYSKYPLGAVTLNMRINALRTEITDSNV